MKKYSRLVRKLTHTLAYFNVPTVFREHVFSPTDVEGYEYKEVHLADIIERAVANETISKKEVDRLRAVAYQEGIWEKRYNAEKQWKNYYRDRAEKLDKESLYFVRLLAGAAERIEERNATVGKLIHRNINLAAELKKPTVQINPPACLNALDALTYTNKTIFAEGQRIINELGFFI